jgi:hypothetical protein
VENFSVPLLRCALAKLQICIFLMSHQHTLVGYLLWHSVFVHRLQLSRPFLPEPIRSSHVNSINHTYFLFVLADAELRLICAKVIKRHILNQMKPCFIVEHDFTMATYLAGMYAREITKCFCFKHMSMEKQLFLKTVDDADKVIVMDGNPGVECVAGTTPDLI